MEPQNSIFYDCPENISFDFKSSDGITPDSFHFHNHYEISMAFGGKLTIINNGDTIQTDKPCLILHRPNTFHAVIAEKGTSYDRYHIYFNNNFLGEISVGVSQYRRAVSLEFQRHGAYARRYFGAYDVSQPHLSQTATSPVSRFFLRRFSTKCRTTSAREETWRETQTALTSKRL